MTRQDLIGKIEKREARVGIVGMGYVGLPLALEFCRSGFRVVGFDIDPSKVEALKAGRSYIRHISAERLQEAFVVTGRADATTDFSRASECDAVIICVPTPLTHHRDPDLTYIEATARTLAPHVHEGQLIVLESTTYPGTTEEVMIPILEAGCRLKAGRDFFVAFSPEREDPNNREYTTRTIPKVVGGLDGDSLQVARALYDSIICRTVAVSSCRAAEATKLMENIFRCVNIALVNELKVVFAEMGIDIWEVVNAAKTKPFGYMPFYPGPGLGGHCIPIDPFYLAWKAKEYGVTTRFIELAGEINTSMPRYVVQKTMLAMNETGKTLKGCRVLVVGLAYKGNVDDARESPSFVLWEELERLGATVSYLDPYVAEVSRTREHARYAGRRSVAVGSLKPGDFDLAIIATAHDVIDHDALAAKVPLVIDTRNACKPAPNVRQA